LKVPVWLKRNAPAVSWISPWVPGVVSVAVPAPFLIRLPVPDRALLTVLSLAKSSCSVALLAMAPVPNAPMS